MKKTIIATACLLGLSTAMASAQSSQGNVGPGTNNNMGTTSGSMSNNNMKAGTTSGMTKSEMDKNRPTSANPSSQGNAGPGTTPSK